MGASLTGARPCPPPPGGAGAAGSALGAAPGRGREGAGPGHRAAERAGLAAPSHPHKTSPVKAGQPLVKQLECREKYIWGYAPLEACTEGTTNRMACKTEPAGR